MKINILNRRPTAEQVMRKNSDDKQKLKNKENLLMYR